MRRRASAEDYDLPSGAVAVGVPSAAVHVVIMGCGRVGAELTIQLTKAGHTIAIVDKRADAFSRLPTEFDSVQKVVGIGFDRDVLIEAGIERAGAFIAVSNGDNSNIVSARVAREYFRVPKVICRIYDPRRADIYEKLDIPTVATVRWAARQIQIMLGFDDSAVESIATGSMFLMRQPIPEHLAGRAVTSLNAQGEVLVAGVERGGNGFLPQNDSTFQPGDVVHLMVQKDALGTVTRLLTPEAH